VFIGVDIGTSNVKAVLVDAHQHVIAEASAPLTTSRPHPSWSEQDPDDWIKATKQAFHALRAHASAPYAATQSISFSGQMHGLVLLNSFNRPLRPCLLHNDGRAVAEAATLQKNHPNLAEKLGVLCMPGFVAPKLLWLQTHEPDVLKQANTLLMPKDYVRLWLCGTIGTDMVDAAGAWLLDEESRNWSMEAITTLGLDHGLLPPLHESVQQVGTIARGAASELGFNNNVVIVAGAGDAAAGSIGLGQVNDGDSFISLGTASQLFVTTARYRPNVPTLVHAFAHGLPQCWFQMAAMLNGASALAWWAGLCGRAPGELINEAQAQGRLGAALFLPYLVGERTPHNNASARATFHGMGADMTRADMTLAVMQGVALTLTDARDALEASGTAIGSVGIAGGGAKSAFWCQLIADAIDRPVMRYQDSAVGPAFGAARLARLAVTKEAASDVCTKPTVDAVFTPSASAVERNLAEHAQWRSLYRSLS
jgi:xylulokinase